MAESIGVSRRIRAAIAEKATDPDPAKRFPDRPRSSRTRCGRSCTAVSHLPRKAFAPGEIIVREGDSGDAAYMIVAGRCRAYRTTPQGEGRRSVPWNRGRCSARWPLILFSPEPRAASVGAIDAVTRCCGPRQGDDERRARPLGLDGRPRPRARAALRRSRANGEGLGAAARPVPRLRGSAPVSVLGEQALEIVGHDAHRAFALDAPLDLLARRGSRRISAARTSGCSDPNIPRRGGVRCLGRRRTPSRV